MLKMELQYFGGRGASSGKGGSIAKMESRYNSLLEKQARLGMSMYIGTPEENRKARKQWNANREKLNAMEKSIKDAKAKQRQKQKGTETAKTFVNSFGEATKRPITNSTYEKAQKKLSKQIMKFIGG